MSSKFRRRTGSWFFDSEKKTKQTINTHHTLDTQATHRPPSTLGRILNVLLRSGGVRQQQGGERNENNKSSQAENSHALNEKEVTL